MGSEIRVENVGSGKLFSHSEPSGSGITKVAEAKDSKLQNMIDVNTFRPTTPLPDKGIDVSLLGSETPLTSSSTSSTPIRVISSSRDATDITGLSPDLYTPKSHVFNPFAPGPEELMNAPRKKPLEESRARVARRLNFDLSSDSSMNLDEEDEEAFLETLYDSIWDVVFSTQVETLLGSTVLEFGLSDGFRTPMSLARVTGIAEECPGAPMKPSGRPKPFIHSSLRRKLDF